MFLISRIISKGFAKSVKGYLVKHTCLGRYFKYSQIVTQSITKLYNYNITYTRKLSIRSSSLIISDPVIANNAVSIYSYIIKGRLVVAWKYSFTLTSNRLKCTLTLLTNYILQRFWTTPSKMLTSKVCLMVIEFSCFHCIRWGF